MWYPYNPWMKSCMGRGLSVGVVAGVGMTKNNNEV